MNIQFSGSIPVCIQGKNHRIIAAQLSGYAQGYSDAKELPPNKSYQKSPLSFSQGNDTWYFVTNDPQNQDVTQEDHTLAQHLSNQFSRTSVTVFEPIANRSRIALEYQVNEARKLISGDQFTKIPPQA